jgi:hypothetical protein
MSVTLVRHRLALGLELFDTARGDRVGPDLRIAFDATARGLDRPPMRRNNSGLHALLMGPKVPTDEVTLRVFDAGRAPRRPVDPDRVTYVVRKDRRRFVPRRFTVPLPPEEDWNEDPWVDGRARRPFLYPGAAYDVPDVATALRGWVLDGDDRVRWVRVEARPLGGDTVIARAHGDDRGEFLLLLPNLRPPIGDPEDPIEYDVVVYAADPPPVPTPALSVDPLWDLPIERFANPGVDDDPVARGEQLPAGYAELLTDTILFEPGRTITRPFNV